MHDSTESSTDFRAATVFANDAACAEFDFAVRETLRAVHYELARAKSKHPKPFNSPHEGWAVIQEEVEELWDEIKADSHKRDPRKMMAEAMQVAAMAVRFMVELEGKR